MIQRAKVSRTELEVLSSFGQLPIHELGKLQSQYDPTDQESVKRAIRTYIIPIVNAWEKHNPGFYDRLKYALWYYIHHQPWHPSKIFTNGDPNIEETIPEINYYIWAWETLFGGQEQTMPEPNEDNFEVVNN